MARGCRARTKTCFLVPLLILLLLFVATSVKFGIPSSLFPVLEAVPGRADGLSNSKLVLLSLVCSGLMASDMSAARF